MVDIPRGQCVGVLVDENGDEIIVPESEHFVPCPACGGVVDRRDLGAVLDHDGPLPHPAGDQKQ